MTYGMSNHKRLSIDIHEEIAFTTEPKHSHGRKCHAVRDRCLAFIEGLHNLGITHGLPLTQAKELFHKILDEWDEKTLKAYFGTREDKAKHLIRRTARYQSGTISVKNIELEVKIHEKAGYLEQLGLVDFEKNGPTWFLLLIPNESIVPEIAHSPTSVKESCNQSIANLSLPLKHLGEQRENEPLGNLETRENIETRENERECYSGRDKSLWKIGELTPLEQAILSAKPCDKEKPLPKIQWQEEDPGG